MKLEQHHAKKIVSFLGEKSYNFEKLIDVSAYLYNRIINFWYRNDEAYIEISKGPINCQEEISKVYFSEIDESDYHDLILYLERLTANHHKNIALLKQKRLKAFMEELSAEM